MTQVINTKSGGDLKKTCYNGQPPFTEMVAKDKEQRGIEKKRKRNT